MPDELAQSSELLVSESERMPSARDSVVAMLADDWVRLDPAFLRRWIVTRPVPDHPRPHALRVPGALS